MTVAQTLAAEVSPDLIAAARANKAAAPAWLKLVWGLFLRLLPWVAEIVVTLLLAKFGKMSIDDMARMASEHKRATPEGSPLPALYLSPE